MSFFSQTRVLIVTGKGGTGKTTVSAVMANLAARAGLRVAVVQVATASERQAPETTSLSHMFGRDEVLAYDEMALLAGPGAGEVRARALRPDTALVEYLHLHGMRRLSRRLVSTGALDVVATAVPGMPDMLVLGKVKQMERAAAAGLPGVPQLIVLDAPAAGHAVRFLQSPQGLLEAASGGPVRGQAQEVVDMLSDPARCQVVLVTTPDETPVSETIETAQLLEDRAGAKLCAVVVNARLPVLALPDRLESADLRALAERAGGIGTAPTALTEAGTAPTAAGAGTALRGPEIESPSPAGAAGAGTASTALTAAELDSLSAAGKLRRQRQEAQATQVARLAEELPLPQLELPFCFSADLGPDQLDALTDALRRAVAGWQPVELP